MGVDVPASLPIPFLGGELDVCGPSLLNGDDRGLLSRRHLLVPACTVWAYLRRLYSSDYEGVLLERRFCFALRRFLTVGVPLNTINAHAAGPLPFPGLPLLVVGDCPGGLGILSISFYDCGIWFPAAVGFSPLQTLFPVELVLYRRFGSSFAGAFRH